MFHQTAASPMAALHASMTEHLTQLPVFHTQLVLITPIPGSFARGQHILVHFIRHEAQQFSHLSQSQAPMMPLTQAMQKAYLLVQTCL